VHETQPGLELFAAPGAKAALSSRVGVAETDQQVEVVIGPALGANAKKATPALKSDPVVMRVSTVADEVVSSRP
jgi:hypothetical protein